VINKETHPTVQKLKSVIDVFSHGLKEMKKNPRIKFGLLYKKIQCVINLNFNN